MSRQPIGVFDSGLGGLTVVREIRRLLPYESIIYYGDIARLPYGIKSREQILTYSIENTLFLLKQKVKALVIACNSSASAAYDFLKSHFNLPVVDVIQPAVASAIATTKSGKIGVIATQSTVSSKVYENSLMKKKPELEIYSVACPLFVPLVEEGWLSNPITDQVIETYLSPITRKKIDTLILGCTHYPLLKKAIQKYVGSNIQLVDSAIPTSEKLRAQLNDKKIASAKSQKGLLKIFVSDWPRNFVRIGEEFLGETLDHVKVVRHHDS